MITLKSIVIGLMIITCCCLMLQEQTTYQISQIDNDLRKINEENQKVQKQLKVLQAEWAMLNDPQRLDQLAQRYLEDMQVTQVIQIQNLRHNNESSPKIDEDVRQF